MGKEHLEASLGVVIVGEEDNARLADFVVLYNGTIERMDGCMEGLGNTYCTLPALLP